MPFTVEVRGDTEVIARLSQTSPAVLTNLRRVVTILALQLELLVKQKLSGQVLNVRTGALRSGIFHDVTSTATSVKGKVASSRDVPYAGIHEFGGSINHPGGTAFFMKEGILQFVSNKSAIADRLPRTKPHVIPMPERSYLRSSLNDMRAQIVTDMKAAIVTGLTGKKE